MHNFYEQHYKLLFNSTNDSILVHRLPNNGRFTNFIEANASACKRLGYTREELLQLSIPDITIQESPKDIAERVRSLNDSTHAIFETIYLTKDGRQFPVEVSSHLFDFNGEQTILSIGRDISKRIQLESKIRFLSEHDELTGLYNRGFFENMLTDYKSQRTLPKGIIICDLDKLKMVNDTLGHQAGDRLIIAAADIVKQAISDNGICCRIGGDEIAVILYGASTVTAQDIHCKIAIAIDEYNALHVTQPLGISVGFSCPANISCSIDELIRQADDNMYKEKLIHHQNKSNHASRMFKQTFEAKDYMADGHLDRLQQMITAFAKNLCLGESKITDLRMFAKFHDIGKATVPEEIIFKKSKLTADEWNQIRRHPEAGFRICKTLPDLVPFPDWILKHHEWWNGKGYPLGLEGEEIPLECRMLAIIDAYDAMTSVRPYRAAMSHEAAISELRRNAGKQFDPVLVDKFISLLSDNSIRK